MKAKQPRPPTVLMLRIIVLISILTGTAIGLGTWWGSGEGRLGALDAVAWAQQSSCGNAVLEPPEECDPPGSITCPPGSPAAAFLPCNQDCTCPTIVPPTTTSTTLPGLDHFQCYEAENGKLGLNVSLVDAFGATSAEVVKVKRVCNPADKNDEDPTAPTHPGHLAGYIIKAAVKPPKQTRQVTNQFGTITITTVRPISLLVPSSKSLVGPPAPPNLPDLNHFDCYKVKSAKQRMNGIKIDDQFGTFRVDAIKPYRLCIPVSKNGEPVPHPDQNLLCYKAKVSPGQPVFRGPDDPVYVNNQFGADTLEVNHIRELCLPSALNPVPTTSTSTTSSSTIATVTTTSTSTTTTTIYGSPSRAFLGAVRDLLE